MLLGLLVPLAFAPLGWFPLAVLGPAGLFLLWEGVSPARAFRRGWLFGAAMFGAGVSWVYISIHVYGQALAPVAFLGTLLFVSVLALFPALVGYCGNLWMPARGWMRAGLTLPALWTLSEWARGWLFTGFPWLDIGYSQIESPLAGFAALLGVYGVGFAALISSGCIALLFISRGLVRWCSVVAFAVLWGGGALLSQVSWTHSRGEALDVSIVQGNIPQEQKWLPAQQQATLATYLKLTASQWGKDLVVWPETAIPLFFHEIESEFLPALQALAQETGTDLVTGIPLLEGQDWEIYNAIMSVGESRGFYRKRHLVPFGEYIPLRRWLGGLLEFFTIPLGDFNRGGADQPLLHAAGYPVGTSICFEIAFGNEIIRNLPQAAWLINVSNDGWFGDSLAPHQHLEIARMRARETGRYLLRATNSGISAIIGPRGGLTAVGPQFDAAVLEGSIVPLSGATPYVRVGDAPVVALTLFVLGLCLSMGRGAGVQATDVV